MFNMTGKAKWDAWNTHKGKTQDQAKSEYVQLIIELAKKYGFDSIAQKLNWCHPFIYKQILSTFIIGLIPIVNLLWT